jgi:prepilin-type N-terminal cleavage/methylation domain-containing protein
MKMTEKGLTLVEILIAMVVASLVLTGILVGNSVIQKNSEAVFQRNRAFQDAHQVLEEIRRVAQTGNFPSNVVSAYSNGGTVAGFTALSNESVRVNYTDVNGDGNATNDNPLDVTVTVNWNENGIRTATNSIRAMVTQQ